jgi:hypothetical protein
VLYRKTGGSDMHTLFDFISNVNTVQYGLSLLFIIGYIIFNEILKPRPFDGLVEAIVEDVKFISDGGKMRPLMKKVAVAPVYTVIYLASLPLLFLQGIAVLSGRGIASLTSAGWSPVRAYFTGRKKAKKGKQLNSK